MRSPLPIALLVLTLTASAHAAAPYEQDITFALTELPKHAGKFFDTKHIDWPAVTREFAAEAPTVSTDQQHLVLLTRLLARLKDGHAAVLPRDKTKAVKWPEDLAARTGPGMFWCQIGDAFYVKITFATAKDAGILPGMQILSVNNVAAKDWVNQRTAQRADIQGFSTPTQALFMTLHWGLADKPGTALALQLKTLDGQNLDKQVACRRASMIPWGPLDFPPNLQGDNNLRYGLLKSGLGYIHFRRTPANLPDLTDTALGALHNPPGLILDFRANGGGGFDHDAFMGRFIPKNTTLAFTKKYTSAGTNPYPGPIVVIIDGNTRSAGETASGIFKEDGRAYMIGESASAGMSSSKTTLELPSGLFALYFSVNSNMGRFNHGKGLEGIGYTPHEIVQYTPADLAASSDTLLNRAQALLQQGFPPGAVPYVPPAPAQ